MSNEIPVDTSTAPPQDFFKEYQKINMHNTAKKMIHGKENDLKWVALEKVHGANFCMIHDGTKIYCCRRNDILHEHETFYNFQMIRDKYKDQIAKLFALLAEPDRLASITGSNDSVLERIMVYGELFGGIYPHKDVQDLGFLHVQKGVYYCPQIEFFAFDVAIKVAENKDSQWINYDLAMELFDQLEFFHAKPLHTGTLKECLDYDIKFNSTIPKLLGLPPLEKNQCEGIVVKTVEPMFYGQHNIRAIFKKKNEKFAEINPKGEKTLYERTRDYKAVVRNLPRYINENRMDSLESKIGPINVDDEQKLVRAVNQFADDVLVDFAENDGELWRSITAEQQQQAKDHLCTETRAFFIEQKKK